MNNIHVIVVIWWNAIISNRFSVELILMHSQKRWYLTENKMRFGSRAFNSIFIIRTIWFCSLLTNRFHDFVSTSIKPSFLADIKEHICSEIACNIVQCAWAENDPFRSLQTQFKFYIFFLLLHISLIVLLEKWKNVLRDYLILIVHTPNERERERLISYFCGFFN